MSQDVQINVAVIGANGKYQFTAVAHQRLSKAEQQIPPEFYKDNDANVPEGEHWELCLMKSPVFKRIDPNVPIHTYDNPTDGGTYVCFTGRITNRKVAIAVFKHWCLGTTFTIEQNVDFSEIGELEKRAAEVGIRFAD